MEQESSPRQAPPALTSFMAICSGLLPGPHTTSGVWCGSVEAEGAMASRLNSACTCSTDACVSFVVAGVRGLLAPSHESS